jgi:hypothetical protein
MVRGHGTPLGNFFHNAGYSLLSSLIMDCCILLALWYLIPIYALIQTLRFIFADADFTLLWARMFGRRPGMIQVHVTSCFISLTIINIAHRLILLYYIFY